MNRKFYNRLSKLKKILGFIIVLGTIGTTLGGATYVGVAWVVGVNTHLQSSNRTNAKLDQLQEAQNRTEVKVSSTEAKVDLLIELIQPKNAVAGK